MMRLLIEHWPWKLLSIALAFALWMGYVSESELATSIAAPLQFRNVPTDLEVANDVPERIYLKVRGPATRLSSSLLAQTSITLDLAEVHAGEQTFALASGNVQLPAGLTLERAVPSQVRLIVEHRATRDVRVETRFSGLPPAGYRIVEQSVRPQTVRIVGPESRVNSLESAQTDAIDLSSTVGTAEFRVPVYVPDPHVRLERDAPVVVTVRLEKTAPSGD